MKTAFAVLILGLGFTFALSAAAAQLEGVTLPDTVSLGGKKLQLNGMGIREATFLNVNVYVAGLYLENKSSDEKTILASPQLKHVEMRFVRDVGAEKMRDAWKDSFENNCEKDCDALKGSLGELLKLMTGAKNGDSVSVSFWPGKVELTSNGKKLGTIESAPFARLLLSCWIGNPPNQGLKDGLLGKAED